MRDSAEVEEVEGGRASALVSKVVLGLEGAITLAYLPARGLCWRGKGQWMDVMDGEFKDVRVLL